MYYKIMVMDSAGEGLIRWLRINRANSAKSDTFMYFYVCVQTGTQWP